MIVPFCTQPFSNVSQHASIILPRAEKHACWEKLEGNCATLSCFVWSVIAPESLFFFLSMHKICSLYLNVPVFKPAGMNFEGYSNLQFDGLHWEKKTQLCFPAYVVTCKPGVIIRLVWSWAHETEGAQGVHGNCHWKSGCRIGQCGSMTAYMSMVTANCMHTLWVVTQDGRIPGSVIRVWSSCMFHLPSFPSLLLFLTEFFVF